MSKTFFTSDTHFSHRRIFKFCPNTRLGNTTHEHDEILIDNWNKQVNKNDSVYILGDVFFSDRIRSIEIMNRLSGIKHLIVGNHDDVILDNKDLYNLFATVDYYKEINIDNQRIILFHYPILEWNKYHRGSFALYGHVHGTLDNHEAIRYNKTMDVGIDSRPDGIMPKNGPMSLWEFSEIRDILNNRKKA